MPLMQRLLVLWSHSPDLDAPICAWSLYDPVAPESGRTGEDATAPYASVIAAMRKGWRVIQYPTAFPSYPGLEHDTSFLKHEFVLEQIQEHAHV